MERGRMFDNPAERAPEPEKSADRSPERLREQDTFDPSVSGPHRAGFQPDSTTAAGSADSTTSTASAETTVDDEDDEEDDDLVPDVSDEPSEADEAHDRFLDSKHEANEPDEEKRRKQDQEKIISPSKPGPRGPRTDAFDQDEKDAHVARLEDTTLNTEDRKAVARERMESIPPEKHPERDILSSESAAPHEIRAAQHRIPGG